MAWCQTIVNQQEVNDYCEWLKEQLSKRIADGYGFSLSLSIINLGLPPTREEVIEDGARIERGEGSALTNRMKVVREMEAIG